MAPERPLSRPPRTWHGSTPPAPGARPADPERRRRVFAVLAAMLALVGAIAAWFLFLSPFHEPAFLSITITEYHDPLPVNAFARRDSEALLKRFPRKYKAFDNQTRSQVLQYLNGLATAEEKEVVVYLCGHARVGHGAGAAKLYLLPADARPDEPDTWLAMGEVLGCLRRCPAGHKLLLLDLFRSPDDPTQAAVPDDPAGAFQALFKGGNNDRFQVLCACSPGQRSLVSEDLGQSVFGFYLDEGLRGYADGYDGGGKKDGRVSVRELAAFVTARVDRWAVRNRGVRQTPVLLGGEDDFDLVTLKQGEPDAPREEEGPGPYPKGLRQGWDLRDAWVEGPAYLLAPRPVHRLEEVLLRQEQEWRGHADPGTIADRLANRVEDLRDEVARAVSRLPAPGDLPSLYLQAGLAEAAQRPRVNAAVAKAVRDALVKLRADTKPDLLDKLKKKPSDGDVAWTVLQLVIREPNLCTGPAPVKFLQEVLRAGRPGPRFAETIYFERLAALAGSAAKEWPGDAVRTLFQVIPEAGTARACRPRELPWVRHRLDAAEAKRRQGEGLLFGDDADARDQAQPLLEEALEGFRKVNRILGDVREAQKARDDGLRLLPGYLPYLAAQARRDGADPARATWLKAVEEAETLADLLADPPGDQPWPAGRLNDTIDRLRRATAGLNGSLDELRRPLRPADPRQVMDPEEGGKVEAARRAVRALHDIEAIVATAWPTAPERARLLDHRRQYARRLNDQARELDRADNQKEQRTKVPEELMTGAAPAPGNERAFRAGLAEALARLAGGPGEDREKLRTLLESALRRAPPEAWAAPAREVLDRAPAGGDRFIRVLAALGADPKSLLEGRSDPTLVLRGRQATAYWKWLGTLYRGEGRGLAKAPASQELLDKLAGRCEDLARGR